MPNISSPSDDRLTSHTTDHKQLFPNKTMIVADKYEVTGELGQGGMGVVYQVRHRELGAVFALKMLRATLLDEAEAVGRPST